MKLILVRHGETEKNVEGKLHSATDPEVLTKKGRQQMELTAKHLLKIRPSSIYCSKERRASESGKIVAKILKAPLSPISGLEERNWGDFANKRWGEVRKILDPMSLEERYKYIPPNGESWEKAEKRMVNVIKKILKESRNKTTVIISHGGTIRILMPFFLKASIEETFKHNPDNASITIFDYFGGKFKTLILNDTSHLRVSE